MAQVVLNETSAADKALGAGGPSVYLVADKRRYRLFLNTPFEIEAAKEYVAEGVIAQKVIDDIGDPDLGKNGYPLPTSCRRVVKMAWPGLSLDATAIQTAALRAVVSRYPARPILLVTKIEAAPATVSGAVPESDEDLPIITVPAEKQQALLAEGETTRPAPLWAPNGANVSCKVIVDSKGKISELETGAQLCEHVDWSRFRYQPTVDHGRAVRVRTEVQLRFVSRQNVPTS